MRWLADIQSRTFGMNSRASMLPERPLALKAPPSRHHLLAIGDFLLFSDYTYLSVMLTTDEHR